jgi:hypothetical protein
MARTRNLNLTVGKEEFLRLLANAGGEDYLIKVLNIDTLTIESWKEREEVPKDIFAVICFLSNDKFYQNVKSIRIDDQVKSNKADAEMILSDGRVIRLDYKLNPHMRYYGVLIGSVLRAKDLNLNYSIFITVKTPKREKGTKSFNYVWTGGFKILDLSKDESQILAEVRGREYKPRKIEGSKTLADYTVEELSKEIAKRGFGVSLNIN